MASKYDGSRLAIYRTGGSVEVVIEATEGQGNAGGALPCKGCFVMARTGNAFPIHMNIGADASGILGIELPESVGAGSPVWVPVSDVSQLYFYGTTDDVVDITYFVG